MKKTQTGFGAALAIGFSLLGLGATAADASFAYQGQLRVVPGTGDSISNSMRTLVFNLYTNETAGASVWQRTVPVSIETDGSFSIDVSDLTGSREPGAPETSLVEALDMGWTAGGLYVGVTDVEVGREFPRTKMAVLPTANCAVFAEGPLTDTFEVGGRVAAQSISASDSFTASNVTVYGVTSVGDLATKNLRVLGATAIREGLEADGGVMAIDVAIGDSLTAGDTKVSRVDVSSADFTVNGRVPLCAAGMIMMWTGSTDQIPEGWELCDGHKVTDPDAIIKTTPDLTGRFLMGTSSDSSSVGGARTVALDERHLPEHKHTFTFGWHGWAGSSQNKKYALAEVSHYGGHDRWDMTTEPAGASQPHENLPPYYAVYYIIKVK